MIVGLVAVVFAAPLTPDDAVVLALARSDRLAAERLEVDAERMRDAALALDSPELQLGHRGLDVVGGQVDPLEGSQIGLAWRPPSLAGLGLQQRAAGLRAEAGWREVDAERDALAAEVRAMHARTRSLREEAELAADRVELMRQVAELHDARVRVELGTALDAGLTALDLLDARVELADARADLGRVEQRLAAWVGRPAPLELAAPPSGCSVPDATVDQLVAEAQAISPALAALDARDAAVRRERSATWAARIPWVDRLQVGWLPGETPSMRARMDVILPIFEPTHRELRALALEGAALEASRRAQEAEIEQDVRSAYGRMLDAEELASAYAEAAGTVEQSERAVEASLAADVLDVLKVAAVQERVLRARRQAVRVELRCELAAIELAALRGKVLETPDGHLDVEPAAPRQIELVRPDPP